MEQQTFKLGGEVHMAPEGNEECVACGVTGGGPIVPHSMTVQFTLALLATLKGRTIRFDDIVMPKTSKEEPLIIYTEIT